MDDLKLYGKNEEQVDSLVNTVRVFSQDIGMEFGINKCDILTIRRGRYYKSEGIELPDSQVIKCLVKEGGYKYLGILESENIKHTQMKEIVSKEYIRRVRKLQKSQQNDKTVIDVINPRAVSIIRYGAGIIKWTKEELANIDKKTTKLLNINLSLRPQADVDRLYMKGPKDGVE